MDRRRMENGEWNEERRKKRKRKDANKVAEDEEEMMSIFYLGWDCVGLIIKSIREKKVKDLKVGKVNVSVQMGSNVHGTGPWGLCFGGLSGGGSLSVAVTVGSDS